MSVPLLLEVPVLADDWRAARKHAIERARRIEVYRAHRIVRTHTEPSIVWAPDFQTWQVTIEFAAPEQYRAIQEAEGDRLTL